MKVLLINGSPKANGNTSIALNEMIKVFAEEGGTKELKTTSIPLQTNDSALSISFAE